MKQLYDYHVHTKYCDGKDSVPEIAKKAVESGFEILGFSGHGYTDFDLSFCMSLLRTDDYIDSVKAVAEQYADKLTVLCGIEQDYFSSNPTTRFDYVIGSVHYLYTNGRYIPLDMEVQTMRNLIDEVYGGDFSLLARDYYALVADVVNKTECNIIGHLDLISKFKNRTELTFDKRYYEHAFLAIEKLVKANVPFEVNLGAIARGYRSSPYPDKKLLKRINELGGKIVITGDCHNKDFLGKNYEIAVDLARECGFNQRTVLTKNGYEAKPL